MRQSKISHRVVAVHCAKTQAIIGTGVQLDAKHVLTCAHVVGEAYGKKEACQDFKREDVLGEKVPLTLQRFNGNKQICESQVVAWYAPKPQGDGHQLADIALLKLNTVSEAPLQQLPCLRSEQLKTKDECLAAGFPKEEGDWISAGYVEKTSNWHLLKAEPGDEFLGGFSGGPVVKCCPSSGMDYLVGITVAQGGNRNKGQMLGVELLLHDPEIAAIIEANFYFQTEKPALVKEKVAADTFQHPWDTIKERCIYFFNRQRLIQEVNKNLKKQHFLALAVKGVEQDDFEKLAHRILYEAPHHKIHNPRQLWVIDFANFGAAADIANTLKLLAVKNFFAGNAVVNAQGDEVESWREVLYSFAEQFFIDEHNNILPARFVFHFKLPPGKLSKNEFKIVSTLLQECIEFKLHSKRLEMEVLVVFSMECSRKGYGAMAKLTQRITNCLYFESLREELSKEAKKHAVNFLPAILDEITEHNLGDWRQCFKHRFKLEDENLYQDLCNAADDFVEKNTRVRYKQLANHIQLSPSYASFLKPKAGEHSLNSGVGDYE